MGRRRHRGRNRGNPFTSSVLTVLVGLVIIYAFVDDFVNQYFGIIFATLVFAVLGVGFLWGGYYIFKQISRIEHYDVSFRYVQRIEHMMKLGTYEFEQYIAFLFKNVGFSTHVTRQGGDNGIDIEMVKNGKKYAVQVKQYKAGNTVGEPAVREFYGSYADGAAEGYFVTTSDFTPAAYDWAKTRTKPLHLINGTKLGILEEMANGTEKLTFGGMLTIREEKSVGE